MRTRIINTPEGSMTQVWKPTDGGYTLLGVVPTDPSQVRREPSMLWQPEPQEPHAKLLLGGLDVTGENTFTSGGVGS